MNQVAVAGGIVLIQVLGMVFSVSIEIFLSV